MENSGALSVITRRIHRLWVNKLATTASFKRQHSNIHLLARDHSKTSNVETTGIQNHPVHLMLTSGSLTYRLFIWSNGCLAASTHERNT